MKATSRPQARRQKVKLPSHTFSLSNAKTYLGRLMDKASRGEAIYIVKGRHRFVLQAVPEIEPIPMRPPGFFANSYSQDEIAEENLLAKTSVVRAPKDLE